MQRSSQRLLNVEQMFSSQLIKFMLCLMHCTQASQPLHIAPGAEQEAACVQVMARRWAGWVVGDLRMTLALLYLYFGVVTDGALCTCSWRRVTGLSSSSGETSKCGFFFLKFVLIFYVLKVFCCFIFDKVWMRHPHKLILIMPRRHMCVNVNIDTEMEI